MAWETRKGIRYYYKKVRENGKVRSIYMGRGKKAEQEAKKIEERKERKKQGKEIEFLQTILHLRNTILLLRAGYHRPNRGAWRKKRIFRSQETAEIVHLNLTNDPAPLTRSGCLGSETRLAC